VLAEYRAAEQRTTAYRTRTSGTIPLSSKINIHGLKMDENVVDEYNGIGKKLVVVQ